MYTYTDIDKTLWLHQPSLIRNRARYRGPRESFKTNQEIMQISYDLHRIEKRRQDLHNLIEDRIDTMLLGSDLEDDVTYGASAEPVVLTGLNDLVARIEQIRTSVEKLEA
jgi:hypothetical protein